MIRPILFRFRCFVLVPAVALACVSLPALSEISLAATNGQRDMAAATPKAASTRSHSSKSASPKASSKNADSSAAKPQLVASFGDWGAYAAKAGPDKTCFALAQPKDRQPGDLTRNPAYIFISERPAENVHDEVSIIMGFDVKGGGEDKVAGKAAAETPEASAEVGTAKFVLVAKRSNLWLKNVAEEAPLIAAMRKNAKLVVRATSTKGRTTTDDYSLSGLTQALDRVHKECR
jgi:hypothetical protein